MQGTSIIKNSGKIFLCILLIITLTAPAVATTNEMFRADSHHTGVYIDGGIIPTNTKLWQFATGDIVYSAPVVSNGVVYVGGRDKNVYAIDAVTGMEKWRFATGNYISSSPAVSNSVVYVGSDDKNVYAIDAVTGTEKWLFKTGEGVRSSPVISGGVVYIGSGDNNIYALDAATGTEKWRFATGHLGASSPAVSDGVVYIGSYDNNVYAIDAATGTEKWRFATKREVISSPAVSGGVVYIGSNDNNIYAIDAATGMEKWRFATLMEVESSPAISDGVVYIGSDDNNIYAIDAATGMEKWRFATKGRVQSSPAVSGGIIYVGSSDANVYALDAATGTEKWRFATGNIVESSPVISEGVIYVGSWDKKVYAIGEKNTKPEIKTVSPTSGTNDRSLSVTVTGTGFIIGAKLQIVPAWAGDVIPATNVTVLSPTALTGDFNLINKSQGPYIVGVLNPDGTSATLTNGFNITGNVFPIPTPLSVTAISPSTGTNDQSVPATVTGTGFKPGAIVKLTLTGQPDIVASGVILTGNSTIACTFDLNGKTTGTWDLAVTNPGDGTTSVRSTAFTITARHTPNTNGTIKVSSTPQDALVYLDGILKGTGSVTLVDVSPGYHSVRVTKTMYNDYVTDVRVSAGSTSYVTAVLPPVAGTINASSNPAGAIVYFDGIVQGISPATIHEVSPGSHTVSFSKSGYKDESRTTTVSAGQTSEISVELKENGWDWLNTTTLIIIGVIVLILAITVALLRKKKNRWDNY